MTMVTLVRWGDRARRYACWSSVLVGLGSGCEVVGEIGAADDPATTTSSTHTTTTSTSTSTDPAQTSSGTTSTDTDDHESDPYHFDLGSGIDTDGDTGPASSSGLDEDTSSEESSAGLPPDDAASSSDGTAGGVEPACCEAALEPGCADPEIEACVCEADEFCCVNAWDDACVDVAVYGACGGACDAPEMVMPGDCCAANENGGGCIDPQVQDCVCGQDPYCCDYAWDEVCVGLVDELGCGMC